MTVAEPQIALLSKLEEIRQFCPEFRLGQMLAAIGNLGEDATGLGLWDIEDPDFAAALDRFVVGLQRRASGTPTE